MTEVDPAASIDELLERAVRAVNDGDLDAAHQLAEQVLAVDTGNVDAEELLLSSTPDASLAGQLRRLTIMFCDLVGSTALSTRHDPEGYRHILGRYKRTCRQILEDTHDGHIAKVRGDGLLVLFGHPSAHEDDVPRAVRAALDVVSAIRALSEQAEREIGESLAARVGVHRGLVYLDPEEDDIYGLAANIAARLHELAPPGAVVVSEEVLRLVGDWFETRPQRPQKVKGLDGPLSSWRVVRERPAHERAVRRGPRWTTPLVGRDDPMRRLRAAWAGRPGAVLLRGESGVGKSRLAGELASEVVAAGARMVEITASPLQAELGFDPLRKLIEQGCRIVGDMPGPERLARLRRHLAGHDLDQHEMVPLVAPVLGLAPDAGYRAPPVDTQKLLADITAALRRYLLHVLGGDPALLLVEDAQWLDDSTWRLLSGLSSVLHGRSHDLLVVVTARDGTGPVPGAEVIDLGPLAPEDSATLVAALDAAGALGAGQVGRLVARGDGIPLYLEQLARAAIEVPAGERPDMPEHRAATTVPEALYQPLLARLVATAGGVQLAGAAATIGREADRAVLRQVVDLDDQALDSALAALVDGLVLELVPGTDQRYRFRHELLREVAYELQPASLRRRVHGRVADALAPGPGAEVGAASWRVLAEHNERADRPAAALECYRQSAEEARRRGALAEALADLDRAVERLWAIPEGPSRNRSEVELRLRRGFLAVSTEGNASPAAASDYERCLELATAGGSSDAMFTTLIALWGYYASRAHLDRAHQVLQLLRTILESGREWFRPENEAGFGMLDWFRGRFHDAHAQLEKAAAATTARDDDVVRAEWFLPNDSTTAIYTHLALARFMRGDPAGAQEAFALAVRRATDLPFPQGPFSRAYALTYASWTYVQMGELVAAERCVDAVQSLAERHGFDFWSLAAATQRAELEVARARRADLQTREALAENAATLAGLVMAWQTIDARVWLPSVLTALGAALGAAGNAAAADERLREALALADETGAGFCTAETLRVRAGLAADPAEVDRRLGAALARAKAQGAVACQLRIARDRHAVVGEAARADLVETLRLFAPGAAYPELDAARRLVG